MAAIYKITNLINNKIYIGQTKKSIQQRFSSHLHDSKSNLTNCYIHKAIRKYNKENFKIEVITEGDYNKEFLDELEKHYIHLYNSRNRNIGYNIAKGGSGLQYIMTNEIKNKIREKVKGNKNWLNKEHKLESKLKISENLKIKYKSGIRWSTCKYVLQY